MSRIHKVNIATVSLLKSKPPQLYISALGTASSSGWRNARLIPHIHIVPPADGIYNLDFEADPPGGISLPVLSPIAVSDVIPTPGWDVKGVRIHGTSGSAEALISTGAAIDASEFGEQVPGDGHFPWLTAGGSTLSDHPVPWPWSVERQLDGQQLIQGDKSQAAAKDVWQAWINKMPGSGQSFHVRGKVQVGNPGIRVYLVEQSPGGFAGNIIQLHLVFVQLPGIWIQKTVTADVKYDTDGVNIGYKQAFIYEDDTKLVEIDVETAS